MFSRRWLINYLLLVLIIIFTWIGMKYPVNEQPQTRPPAIIELNARDVERIRIETADASYELSKQGARWMLTDPLQWFANNVTAERLASLAAIEPQSTLARSEIDLSTLGLSIPRAVVTLNRQAIYFGGTNQIGNRRYLMTNDTIMLAADSHYPFISQGLSALIDNRLLPASLQLRSLQTPSFRLMRQDHQWQSDNTAHDAERTAQLVHNWQTRQASTVTPYDRSQTPLYRVKANTDAGETIEFLVSSIQPDIVIARPDLGVQFHFPASHYYDLLSLDSPNE